MKVSGILRDFYDRGSVGLTEKCSLLKGIRCIGCQLFKSLTVEVKYLVA